MFTWIDGNVNTLIATISENSIILNQKAASYFSDIRYVSVGIDEVNHLIAIHPVTKKELDLAIFTPQQLHTLSIGKGYAKISNKNLCTIISELLQKRLNSLKYNCYYEPRDHHLVINLNDEIRKEN